MGSRRGTKERFSSSSVRVHAQPQPLDSPLPPDKTGSQGSEEDTRSLLEAAVMSSNY